MNEIISIEELNSFIIENSKILIIYFFSPRCGVCNSMIPKLSSLFKKFDFIDFKKINIDKFPEVAGRFSIFSLPALLLFHEGKEIHREAKIISIYSLEEILIKYGSHLSSDSTNTAPN